MYSATSSQVYRTVAACVVGASAVVAVVLAKRFQGQRSKAITQINPSNGHDVRKVGFSKKRVPERIDVIIIGSGISGLACGATLAKASGLACVILEQHDIAGGATHAFELEHQGVKAEFDTGLHYVGGEIWKKDNILRRVLDWMTDDRFTWQKMDEEYDRASVGTDGERELFAIPAGRDALRRMLVERFPDEVAAIDAYFVAVASQQACAGAFFGSRIWQGLLPMFAPLLQALEKPHRRLSDLTVREVLEEVGCSERLLGVLTYHWGNMGLPPAQLSFAPFSMMANHYFDGACYPVGGSGVIASSFCHSITATGGRVFVRAPVAQIITENGRAVGVRLHNGSELRSRLGVVSTVGVRNTFWSLLDEDLAVEARAKLAPLPPSVQHAQLFVILDDKVSCSAANTWVCPGFDHDANSTAHSEDTTTHFPAVLIAFPSAKDPSWASRYPSVNTCVLVTSSSYDLFASWASKRVKHRGADYEALKAQISEKLLDVLFREFPELRGHVLHHELGTPLSTQFYLGSPHGESYGLACTRERYREGMLRPHTGIKGLFLAGQDVVSPGVCGALLSGYLTALAMRPWLALWHLPWIARL